MNALVASLDAQLAQVSSSTGSAAGGANASQINEIKAQLASAQSALSAAQQGSNTSDVTQIAAQLQSAQGALAQLMLASGQTTGLLSTSA
jgi:hypothetical protein